MKDKRRTLLSAEIQVTPFDESYNEIDQMLFLSKNLYNACLYIENNYKTIVKVSPKFTVSR